MMEIPENPQRVRRVTENLKSRIRLKLKKNEIFKSGF
jgi:hypothetical protein